jgi:hypothetical protein
MDTHAIKDDLLTGVSELNITRDIDDKFESILKIYAHADHELLNRRLIELDEELNLVRALKSNAMAITVTGAMFGLFASRKWVALPFLVSGLLMQYAMKGSCLCVATFRHLHVRAVSEIERERYAIKMLLGDYNYVKGV